jgi:hypothetical protein
VALARQPVTIDQLAERLGLAFTDGRRLTRREIHRLARAAWAAQRAGLLVEAPSHHSEPSGGRGPAEPLFLAAGGAHGAGPRVGESPSPTRRSPLGVEAGAPVCSAG